MPPKVPKRLELQITHLKDMIREQQRMVLADVEPTPSDREDMMQLLESVKQSSENEGAKLVNHMKPRYDEFLKELSELGYNVAAYKLEIMEATPKVAPPNGELHKTKGDSPINAEPKQAIKAPSKPTRHVHFEENVEDVYGDQLDPFLSHQYPREPIGRNVRAQYRDDPSEDLRVSSTSSQLFEENQLLMEDQDRRLELIGDSVGRQRSMGVDINSELTHHNNLLEDMEAQVDRSGSRLSHLTKGVQTFNRKSRECGTCSVILLLILILFIVIII